MRDGAADRRFEAVSECEFSKNVFEMTLAGAGGDSMPLRKKVPAENPCRVRDRLLLLSCPRPHPAQQLKAMTRSAAGWTRCHRRLQIR
jgi:hypothetical protein